MSLICINKNHPEYQALKKKSNIQEPILEAICRTYQQKYNRFPYLDELPNANSEPHLREKLNLNTYNSASIKEILKNTDTQDLEQANISLNNEYRDLDVDITPIHNDAIVEVTHRPTNRTYTKPYITTDTKVDEYQVFNNALTKLANKHGINLIPITNAELNSEKWKNIPQVAQANAFIYNGDIYINIDKNSVDAPLHEMMHLLVGSMRFTEPKTYQQLIDSIEQMPQFELLAQKYPGRTMNDVKEEIFVSEIAKYIIGDESALSSMDESSLHEILYHTKRLLDTILMGENSVTGVSDGRLFNMSLKQLAFEMNSTTMSNQSTGIFNIEGSALHRKLNNIKSDLLKKNQLEEYCE